MTKELTQDLPAILYGQGDRLSVLKAMLVKLGQPDQAFKIIHVAGTNGKGSTSTMISRILSAYQFRTGLFTSPHLVTERESIQLNSEMISLSDFQQCLYQVHQAAYLLGLDPQHHLSQFETVFLVAMVYFANCGCDYCVLECGVGGALDATNAINHSDYAIFTKIGLDHLNLLGESLEEIVATKSGIIRPHQVVVVAPHQKAGVLETLCQKAHQEGACCLSSHSTPVKWLGKDQYRIHLLEQEFEIRLPLIGTFQGENLQTVMTWLEKWVEQEGMKLDPDRINNAFDQLKMPGRFEKISDQPPIYLDAAHNVDAIQELIASIQTLFPNQPINILCGFLEDKDVSSIIDLLGQLPAQFYLTTPDFPERALPAEALWEMFKEKGIPAQLVSSPQAGMAVLRQDLKRPGMVIGSFHLIKCVRGRSCDDE